MFSRFLPLVVLMGSAAYTVTGSETVTITMKLISQSYVAEFGTTTKKCGLYLNGRLFLSWWST